MKIFTDTDLSLTPAKNILDSIEVRPILPEEKNMWDELMQTHHYLGFHDLIGEGMRYVAVYQDYWLALLGWASAALCCTPRDKWIGWASKFRQQRLFLVANNVRFLILPSVRIHNLASKILSLNLKRLSKDWQGRFNHPIVLAETFVDPRYFVGTCYQASGWTCLGETKGFAKSAKKYIQHNHPKKVWIKPIHKSVNDLLTQPILPSNMRCSMQYTIPFPPERLDELRQLLLGLPDFRTATGKRHQLVTIVSIAICATLCGARSYLAIAEWAARCTQSMLRRFRARYDMGTKKFISPSEPTIRRVLQNIDSQAVDNGLTGWVMNVTQGDKNSLIAVDGKTLKGAKDSSGKQVQLLTAFLCNPGVVISQRKIDSKTNEIPEIKPLLAPLKIAGSIITADAMHTQTDTAKFIVEEKRANYVFTVKDNQKTLNDEIKALDLESSLPEQQTIEKAHGRLETRSIWTTSKLSVYINFPYANQVFMIKREVTNCKTQKTSVELVAGITNLSKDRATPGMLLRDNRLHWGVEDRLHYVRDFTFDEDRSQIKTNNGPQMMACIRNFVISIFNLLGLSKIASAIRFFASKPYKTLAIFGF